MVLLRNLSIGIILLVATSSSSPAQNSAQQWQQLADAVPTSYAQPVANYDPLGALEAKVHFLESQIGALQSECGNSGNKECESGLYFGAAAFFAKPHLKEAFQHSQTNVLTGQQTLVPFEYDYEGSPRAWLGLKGKHGFGVRGTFWNFDADGQSSTNVSDGLNIFGAHAVSVIFPANILAAAPGDVLQNSDSLKTQLVGLYGTYDTTVGSFKFSGGAGLRYANLEQSLNSTVVNAGGVPTAQLNWEREYNGLGPSVTVEVSRHIGNSPFSAVFNGGGSLLFGTKTIDRTVFGDQSPQPASPFLRLDEADEVVGIGEVGMGLQWSRPLRSGHHLKISGTYEGQLWAEAGAPTLGFLGFEGFAVRVELKR